MGVSSILGAVEILKEEFDVAPDKIEEALRGFVEDDGFSLFGAISKFRSLNKNRKKTSTAEYVGRLIGKGGKRVQEIGQGRASPVTSTAWLMLEGGTPMLYEIAFWGDERSEWPRTLERGECYKFNGKRREGGFTHVGDLEKVINDEIPTIHSLVDYGIEYAKLNRIQEYLKTSDIFRGYVGRLIKAKNTDTHIGFEIGDVDAGPFTVWSGGQFEDPDPEENAVLQSLGEGMEVLVYGYVSQKEGDDPHINARGLWVI